MTLRNDFEETLNTLQLVIGATKLMTSQKQNISALTGGRGGRGVRGGRGRGGGGGGGNHYQGKWTYKGGHGKRG